MEDPFPSSSSFLDHYYPMNNSTLTEILEYCECERSSSFGFIELLNTQDSGPNSVFDILQPTVEPLIHSDQNTKKEMQESSEALNGTPNYSSISSESSGGHKDEQENREMEEEEDKGEENQKTKKQLKPRKTSQKRQRERRFAFMTKSEVDHLEDGYRWRKYGQKAVKNSHFPRSYYKCTNVSCNVKKRVERSCNDPSIVVTTYEGEHTHPSPQTKPRPYTTALTPPYSGLSAENSAPSQPSRANGFISYQQQLINYSAVLNGYMGFTNDVNSGGGAQQMSFTSHQSPAPLLRNYGLLRDVVPWLAVKEEEQY